ncbi:MAG: hypothetical protein KDE48_19515, partial [Anaerolineales bacterium]|nr:hypothetical protein [Anaerolineales bacterium]
QAGLALETEFCSCLHLQPYFLLFHNSFYFFLIKFMADIDKNCACKSVKRQVLAKTLTTLEKLSSFNLLS